MAELHSVQLWLPSSALQCQEEFDHWAAKCTAANGLWLDYCSGLINFEEYLELCRHYGVDVDEFLTNLEAEISFLGG